MSEMQIIGAGLEALEQKLDVIAGNLANANTPGYRRAAPAVQLFETMLDEGYVSAGEPVPHQTSRIDFTPGDVTVTENPLDVAIRSAQGFFEVRLDDGSIGYTRDGRFARNEAGELTTQLGFPVSGETGPITIPGDGKIGIAEDGTVTVGEETVGKIKVVGFARPELLVRGRRGTLSAPPTAVVRPVEDPDLKQGAYEGSNVSATRELVGLIEAQRAYERKHRVLQMIGEASASLIRAAQST
jgi:flagellar basal body rod protein FlgG